MKKLAPLLLLAAAALLSGCATTDRCAYAQPYSYSANTPNGVDHFLDWLEYSTERGASVFLFRPCKLGKPLPGPVALR